VSGSFLFRHGGNGLARGQLDRGAGDRRHQRGAAGAAPVLPSLGKAAGHRDRGAGPKRACDADGIPAGPSWCVPRPSPRHLTRLTCSTAGRRSPWASAPRVRCHDPSAGEKGNRPRDGGGWRPRWIARFGLASWGAMDRVDHLRQDRHHPHASRCHARASIFRTA
jgi:hypothetical protein